MKSYTVLLLLVAAYSTAGAHPDHSVDKKPNILFMMVDDWGWANVGYHRDTPTKDISTPNMDWLVNEGLQLDQHYVYNWCSPSRSAFLSGRVPIHVNEGMTVFVTKLQSAAGYSTYQVGKWYVGSTTTDHIPTGRGFDTSLARFHSFLPEKFVHLVTAPCRA